MNRSASQSDLVILTVAGILTVIFSAILLSHHKREDPFSLTHLNSDELNHLWQTDLFRRLPPNNRP